tara:strand:+ start:10947 stop:13604 length:2658 start_codon:yes stop_codon:yes gene_type:complete
MSWYKQYRYAKMGSIALEKAGVPSTQVPRFIEYLHSLPDNLQKYLYKFIRKNPLMSVDELKGIPIKNSTLTVDPKFESMIKNMSEGRLEREWLKKLVLNGRFQAEDAIKLKGLLDDFDDVDVDNKPAIESFDDDIALAKYLKQFKNVGGNTSKKGDFELLDSAEVHDKQVELYLMNDQLSLDSIAGTHGASWCVLSENGAADYEPFVYYCFVVDGIPEVLIHLGSSQMKDKYDGPLHDGHIVGLIRDMVEKHKFLDVMRSDIDTQSYIKTTNKIDNINSMAASDDPEAFEELEEELFRDHTLMHYIDEQYWPKFMPSFKTSVDSLVKDDSVYSTIKSRSTFIDDINSKLLSSYAVYLKINSGSPEYSESFNALEEDVVKWFKVDEKLYDFDNSRSERFLNSYGARNLSVGRYKKKIPKALRTNRVTGEFTSERERVITEYKEILGDENLMSSVPDSRTIEFYTDCPFDEIRKDPKIKETIKNSVKSQVDKNISYLSDPDIQEFVNEDVWRSGIQSYLIKLEGHSLTYASDLTSLLEVLRKCPFDTILQNENMWKKIFSERPSRIIDDDYLSEPRFPKTKNIWEVAITSDEVFSRTNKFERSFKIFTMCPFDELKYDPAIFGRWKELWKAQLLEHGRTARMIADIPEIRTDKEFWRDILDSTDKVDLLTMCPIKEMNEDPEEWRKFFIKSEGAWRFWQRHVGPNPDPSHPVHNKISPVYHDPNVAIEFLNNIKGSHNLAKSLESIDDMPADTLKNPEVMKVIISNFRKGWAYLDSNVLKDSVINNPEIKKLVYDQEIALLKEDFKNHLYVPDFLPEIKETPEYWKAYIIGDFPIEDVPKQMLDRLSQDPEVARFLPKEIPAQTSVEIPVEDPNKWASAFNDNIIRF